MAKNEQFEKMLEFIKPTRLRRSTRGDMDVLVETESDKGRIINSAAFRRLQQKAQVFPLDTNAAVRTRLTHSIEVSQIGRYLAQQVIEGCGVQDFPYYTLAAFANTVESSCLLHDIGNPPFGHLGEAAIREWSNSNGLPSVDIDEYDGNPQGFRLISFLNGSDEYGMNLTSSLLLSTIKYPWSIYNKSDDAYKVGIYSSDWQIYENACSITCWKPGRKFPFARLMEAADDIAYSMSDLEDGIEKGIITEHDLREEFGEELVPLEQENKISPYLFFKTMTIRNTVEEAANIFVDNLDKILEGEDIELVDKGKPNGGIISRVKKYARKNIYSDTAAETIELSGRSIISGLLRHFSSLLNEKITEDIFLALINNDFTTLKGKNLDFELRLMHRLPLNYRKHYQYKSRGDEMIRRVHLIIDFISGMTDDFALETYQILEGIRVK